MAVDSERRRRRRSRWGQAIVVLLAVIAGWVAAWAGSPRDQAPGGRPPTGNVGSVEETDPGGAGGAPSVEE